MNTIKFTQEDKNFIKEEYQRVGNTKTLQKHFNVSKYKILKTLKDMNVELVKICDRKFYNGVTIDRCKFLNFDSEGDWYFYGLILADGSLHKNNYIQIALEQKDLKVLEQFKNWLNSSNKISLKTSQRHENGKITEMCCFTFADKTIAKNLKDQGLDRRKTLQESVPEFYKNEKSRKDFWRGFIDGDGHIAQRHSSILELCGSYSIIKSFSNYCSTYLNKPIKVFREDTKTKGFYRISYSGKDARELVKHFYSDCEFFLDRKQKFVDVFKEVETRPSVIAKNKQKDTS